MTWTALILCIGAMIIWQIYRQTRDDEEEMAVPEAADTVPVAPQRKMKTDIIVESLRKLQCNPEVIEDKEEEGRIDVVFVFQAEHFIIKTSGNSAFFTLCDVNWYSFDEKDIYQLGAVKRIVNNLNYQTDVNVCYSQGSKDGTYVLYTFASMVCVEGETFDRLLAQKLQECFVVHHLFFKALAEEMANKKE